MIPFPTSLVLLSFVFPLLLSGCSEFKKTAEYRDIVADYNDLKQQITGNKAVVFKPLPNKKSPLLKRAIRSNCNTILRDLSKPNATIIWCMPEAMR